MVLTLEQYSEKSLAIFGDTAPYKERLLELGGKYIPNLKGRAGWIFFLNMREILEHFVADINSRGNSTTAVVDDVYCIPSTDTAKELTQTLTGIQIMIRQLQQQFNSVMDLVEKSRVEQQKTVIGGQNQPNVRENVPDEDIGERPKSLLRR